MMYGLILWAQGAQSDQTFDWAEGIYVLLIVLVILGGLLSIEALHGSRRRLAARQQRPPRRAEGKAPDETARAREMLIDQSALSWPQRVAWGRALLAGVLGTAVMTLMTLLAAAGGLPKLDAAALLAGVMGDNLTLGWIAHFAIGIVLALIYALWFAVPLPGPFWARGAVYSLLPFFAVQLVVIPLMGGGFFSAAMPTGGALVTLSLIGHLVYGAVMGGVYASPPGEAMVPQPASAGEPAPEEGA